MRRLVVGTLAVAGLLALGLGWWSTATDTPDPGGGDAAIAVRTAEVRELEAAGPTLTATVEDAVTLAVTAPRQAAVAEVAVAEGERVAPGDVLVRFEQTTERAAVMSAEAELDQAREQLSAARDRADTDAFAGSDLTSEERLAELEAQVEAARDRVEAARADLAAQNVEAPAPGRVASIAVARGELVTAGGLLVELRRADTTAVRFEMPRDARAPPEVDDGVEILADGEAHAGRVVATYVAADEVAADREVVVEPEHPDGLPSPGATVRVRLPAGETTWLTVPEAALIDDARGRRVFRVDRGVAWSLPVETAPAADAGGESATAERVVVRGALQPGERVATTELDRLTDGAPVVVLDDER
jgi:membrane fusion protein (multidrug efflux system)